MCPSSKWAFKHFALDNPYTKQVQYMTQKCLVIVFYTTKHPGIGRLTQPFVHVHLIVSETFLVSMNVNMS